MSGSQREICLLIRLIEEMRRQAWWKMKSIQGHDNMPVRGKYVYIFISSNEEKKEGKAAAAVMTRRKEGRRQERREEKEGKGRRRGRKEKEGRRGKE